MERIGKGQNARMRSRPPGGVSRAGTLWQCLFQGGKPVPTRGENALACRPSDPRLPVLPAMAQFQFFDDTTSPSQGPAHVARLRTEMARRGLDGFIVPRADEHQGEYVPRSAERLAWLTGFTGSAGTAVILRNEAALVVDGRYTVQ